MSGLVLEGADQEVRRCRRRSSMSTCPSPTAPSSACSGRRAAGRRRCLRMIAGLEEPSAGRILIDGNDITGDAGASARLRHGVPVAGALSAPDRRRATSPIRSASAASPRREQDASASASCWSSSICRASPTVRSRSFPAASGSASPSPARWRCSPKLFLLDEPLSALDAKLREAMQVELRQLQQQPRHHHDRRHPRPARGDDHGRPGRRHGRGAHPAGGLAARYLPAAERRLRRRLHRLDQPHSRHGRTAAVPPLPAGPSPASRCRRRRRTALRAPGGHPAGRSGRCSGARPRHLRARPRREHRDIRRLRRPGDRRRVARRATARTCTRATKWACSSSRKIAWC